MGSPPWWPLGSSGGERHPIWTWCFCSICEYPATASAKPIKYCRSLTKFPYSIAFFYDIPCRVLRAGCSGVWYVSTSVLSFGRGRGRGGWRAVCPSITCIDSNVLCNSYCREWVLSIPPRSGVPLVHDSDVREAWRQLGRERFCVFVITAPPYPVDTLQIRPSASQKQPLYSLRKCGGVGRQFSQVGTGILASQPWNAF